MLGKVWEQEKLKKGGPYRFVISFN